MTIRFLFWPGHVLTGATGAWRAVGHIGVGRSHLFMLCAAGPAEASRRLRSGPPPAGAIRSVSWKGDRAVRTGCGPGRGRRRTPPRTARPGRPRPRDAARLGPSAPRMAPGPAPPAARRRHRRTRVGGRLTPMSRSAASSQPARHRRHGPRRGCGCSSPALGFLGGQVLAALSVAIVGRRLGQPALADRHHQAVRTAHLVHRVDARSGCGPASSAPPGCRRRSGGPTAWSGTSACGSGGST